MPTHVRMGQAMVKQETTRKYEETINWPSIIAWYSSYARDLPWRTSRSPYAVWVSEIMLQQTTVTTVVPYFEKFMAQWPTVHHLAQASLEDVLQIWQGLGYYRRARSLHQAAQIITHNGWPTSVDDLQKLPGIGPYTARALAAIAFDMATLPVDGNIARVMARRLGWQGPKARIIKQLEKYAWGNIPQPHIVAQALMDLGQAICKPRQPLCERCPLQRECLAPGSQPFHDVATAPRQLFTQALCMLDENGALMCEEASTSAPSCELLRGLWGPLMAPWRADPYDTFWHRSTPDNPIYCGTLTHIFSHIRLKVDVYRTSSYMRSTPSPARPFSKLALKIIDCAKKAPSSHLPHQ